MSSVDTLDERDVAQRVLEILAKECQPVPIASLSTELLRDSAQGGEFRAHISSKYGRGIGAFKSFLQNSPVLRDAVSLLQTEFGIRVQLKASGCQGIFGELPRNRGRRSLAGQRRQDRRWLSTMPILLWCRGGRPDAIHWPWTQSYARSPALSSGPST